MGLALGRSVTLEEESSCWEVSSAPHRRLISSSRPGLLLGPMDKLLHREVPGVRAAHFPRVFITHTRTKGKE